MPLPSSFRRQTFCSSHCLTKCFLMITISQRDNSLRRRLLQFYCWLVMLMYHPSHFLLHSANSSCSQWGKWYILASTIYFFLTKHPTIWQFKHAIYLLTILWAATGLRLDPRSAGWFFCCLVLPGVTYMCSHLAAWLDVGCPRWSHCLAASTGCPQGLSLPGVLHPQRG